MLCLFAQVSEPAAFETSLLHRERSNASLYLACEDCSAIHELEINGMGLSFKGAYSGEEWREIFPKRLPLLAGDYVIRIKLRNKNWKTLHFYVRKNQRETLMLN